MNVFLLMPFALIAALPEGADTLVVCPRELRPAIAEWELYRRAQGHRIEIVEPHARAEQLRASIRRAGRSGQLKYVVLIGDMPSADANSAQTAQIAVPTTYEPAKVNLRWGPEKEIASDTPYADLNDDGIPDVALGRIPARSAAELAAVVRKSIRYERQPNGEPWQKRLNIVSVCGGFGAVTDAIVEGAGRQVIQQTVPPGYDVRHIASANAKTGGSNDSDFGSRARGALCGGGLAWVYIGHGLPTRLDHGPATGGGRRPILSTSDVPGLRCGPHYPLAIFIACYTGAMDAPQGCLAEQMLLAEEGPAALVAATRVTMPYGNSVLGYEMLRACFRDRPNKLGDVLHLAQQRALSPAAEDPMRATLDGMAQLLSPAPVDLIGERREHVLMYHLIGDPLLRLHLPATEVAVQPSRAAR